MEKERTINTSLDLARTQTIKVVLRVVLPALIGLAGAFEASDAIHPFTGLIKSRQEIEKSIKEKFKGYSWNQYQEKQITVNGSNPNSAPQISPETQKEAKKYVNDFKDANNLYETKTGKEDIKKGLILFTGLIALATTTFYEINTWKNKKID